MRKAFRAVVRRIADPRRTTLFDRYTTILAYCVVTSSMIDATVWHPTWGYGPTARSGVLFLQLSPNG